MEVTLNAQGSTLNAQGLAELVERCRRVEQIDMPVTHRFAPGVYLREIFMPRGTFVIGHRHRTEHFNIVLRGRGLVWMDGAWVRVEAPCTFVSRAGVQKILQIEEDMVWQTVHVNPGEDRDIVKLEEDLIDLTAEQLAEKGGRTVDEWRHAVGNIQHSTPSIEHPMERSTLNAQLPTLNDEGGEP